MNPPRSWDPTGVRPASENESRRDPSASLPVTTSAIFFVWTWDCGKSQVAGPLSTAEPWPAADPFGWIVIVPRTCQSLRQEPPTWRWWAVALVISSAHTVGLGAVCVGVGVPVGRAPGSSTPGGKGSEREAMNAPAATAAAKTTTHRMILTAFGTVASLSRLDQATPRPVISARSDSPKQMKAAAVNRTHGSVQRPPPACPRETSRDITCATPRITSGPKP